ncbi:ChaN family lipoprotein [uncultured Shimia sp.]|uniref:ChaN family lipoprotein n=1 Tax=uncultured Shimia sp. TaxID=573152 RepID=UPI0026176E79|nr:ChaN family lipoprotein [uncultured Shimia sp.]
MKMMFAPLIAALFAGSVAAQTVSYDVFHDADVVFLGEIHDNPIHHDNQTQALLAIAPKAVVFEMLVPEQAAQVTQELLDDQLALDAALGWAESGWPDFAMYSPIFAVLGDAKVFGAQVPREAAGIAFKGGDMSGVLDGAGADFGLTLPLPKAQQEEREALQLAAHCDALPDEMLPGMVMAQRLRDARLAQAVTEALAETGGPVAVITGNGHARTDWGAPVLLPKEVSSMSLGQFESEPEGAQPYDLWIVTEAAERDDPCEAFK